MSVVSILVMVTKEEFNDRKIQTKTPKYAISWAEEQFHHEVDSAV